MTTRGRGKPPPSSAAYTIWGTDTQALHRNKQEDEALNNPNRARRSTKKDARTAELQRKVDLDMQERYEMRPVRQQDQVDDELNEEAA